MTAFVPDGLWPLIVETGAAACYVIAIPPSQLVHCPFQLASHSDCFLPNNTQHKNLQGVWDVPAFALFFWDVLCVGIKWLKQASAALGWIWTQVSRMRLVQWWTDTQPNPADTVRVTQFLLLGWWLYESGQCHRAGLLQVNTLLLNGVLHLFASQESVRREYFFCHLKEAIVVGSFLLKNHIFLPKLA